MIASVVRAPGLDVDDLDGEHLSSAGRSAVRLDDGLALYGGCAGGSVNVDVGSGQVLVVTSRGAADEDVEAVAAALDVDEAGAIVGEAPAGWVEAGRLAPGWTRVPGATTATVADGMQPYELLVQRVDPGEAAVLEALLCADPRHDMQPPTSVERSVYDGQEARTITTDEGPARVGVIGPGALVGILGDRVLSVLIQYRDAFPSDAALAGLLGRIVALPDDEYDAIAARFDQARGDAAMAAAAAAGPVVAEVTVDGSRLALATGVMAGGGLCSTVVWSAGGQYPLDPADAFGGGGAACLPEAAEVQPSFGIGSSLGSSRRFHVLVEVPPQATSVQVLDASGAAHPGVVVAVAPDRNVGLVVPPATLVAGLTSDENGAMQPILSGGPITVQWLDATGAVVAFEVVGATAA